ncbi:hypothetical protein Tco_0377703, partial [Tanacetum coccineum]
MVLLTDGRHIMDLCDLGVQELEFLSENLICISDEVLRTYVLKRHREDDSVDTSS